MMISLDGYVAAPNQSRENPFGEGGMRLNEWLFPLRAFREMHGETGGEENASSAVVAGWPENIGATVMGRNMFGGGPGPWGDDPWPGWWGDDPPYHHAVYVITHHARPSLEMRGGTVFHFVTEGPEAALEQARGAAGEQDVRIGGGAATVRHFLATGAIDELGLSLVPVLLGAGERLLDDLGADPPALEQIDVVPAPGVTHLRYRVS
jgi:dihydrofolate reductase